LRLVEMVRLSRANNHVKAYMHVGRGWFQPGTAKSD